MSRFRWEPGAGASGRYRDTTTGRFVPGSVVRGELDHYLSSSEGATKALAQGLRNRELSLADWELGMRREIKRAQLNAIAMERGGWANIRPQDYGRAGQIVREQYGYLRDFANDIFPKQTQRLDGTLDRRARMYTDAARTSFYQSKHANRGEGVVWVRSIRNARDSCQGCIDLHGIWYRVEDPAYRLPGQRTCLTNCLCSEELGSGEEGRPKVEEAI